MGKIVNLVFEGGGVKGLAYVGAIKALVARGSLKTVKHIAGASAGAMTALALGLGFTADEIEKLLNDMDLSKFGSANPLRLTTAWGLNSGDKFYQFFCDLIKERLGSEKATFADLHAKVVAQNGVENDFQYRDIHLIGANLSTQRGELFSYYTTANMPVVDAVRISMSFPLFFDAKIYLKDTRGHFVKDNEGSLVEDKNGHMFVDGGLARNFPVGLFDTDFPNPETLGFRVDSPQEIEELTKDVLPQAETVNSWLKYGKALIQTAQSAQNTQATDNFRTVYINVGNISTLKFNLTEAEKAFLLTQGKNAVEQFFSSAIKLSPAMQDLLRGQKRDRERLLAKASSIYFQPNQPVLQLTFEIKPQQSIYDLEDKISKYVDWLKRHLGVVSLQHHKRAVDSKLHVIILKLSDELQKQVSDWVTKNPQAKRHDQLIDEKAEKLALLFERPDHPRPTWMVDPEPKKEDKSALRQCVINDDIHSVTHFLQVGIPTDSHNEKKESLLHEAANIGSARLVQLLLSRRLNPNALNTYEDSPLHLAVKRFAFANDPGAFAVKHLCQAGAKVNQKNIQGSTALLEAADAGHSEAVKILLTNGANPNLANTKGLTPLMLAALRGHKEVVEILLNNKANPALKDNEGYSALSKAAKNGNAVIVALITAAQQQRNASHSNSVNSSSSSSGTVENDDDDNNNETGARAPIATLNR